jgi:hypothetical protein
MGEGWIDNNINLQISHLGSYIMQHFKFLTKTFVRKEEGKRR